jgi:hypothetical protein
MPASSFLEHVAALRAVLDSALASGEATSLALRIDQRSVTRGMIEGVIEFRDGSQLHLREFIDVETSQERLMYAYHYQAADRSLRFRYDNAAHRPPIALPAPQAHAGWAITQCLPAVAPRHH